MLTPRELADLLGGEVRPDGGVSAPGPGHSAKDRSLSVMLSPTAPDGFVCYSHADVAVVACRDHVRHLLGLPAFRPGLRLASAPPRPRKGAAEPNPDDAERTRRACALWAEARPPAGTAVERYLAGRGLHLDERVIAADVLRFHPACPFGTSRLPTMVALMRNVRTSAPQAVHRTALDGARKAVMPDGSSPKKMLGPAKGACVKLIADAEVTLGLGLAEGIETALAVMRGGWSPVWAAGSAGAIKAFPVLSGVESFTVFADADPVGITDAEACAATWRPAGKEARVMAAPQVPS